MTTRWRRLAIAAAAVASAGLVAGACGKARTSGGGNGNTGGGGPTVTEQLVNPYGFTIQVTGVDLPTDPTSASSPPTVTFRVADASGAPITDLKDELQKAPNGTTPASGYPYVNAPRFTLARLEPDDTYHSVYMNQANNQAVSVTLPRDPTQYDARVASNGNGAYTFKLDPLSANPTADERGRTWTAGTWASRRATQQTAEDQAASSTLNFVPSGGTPTTKQVVALAACNTCHGPAVRAHGTRLGVQLCLTCHTPQTSDPDTGNSVEFVELIHKIHYGGDRPGPTYTIIGFQGAVTTFNEAWMNDVRNCTLCHQGSNADRHVAQPSLRACTTCHSVVKFDDSAAASCTTGKKDTADCNHPGGAVTTGCADCHTATEIPQRHPSIFAIAAQNWKYEIQGATVGADRKPTVRFAVRDAQNQPIDLTTDASYKDPASSLNVQIGWPPKDYTNAGTATTQTATSAPGQPRSIAIVRGGAFNPAGSNVTTVSTGVYEVTSPVAIPQDVTSFTVFMDGHPVSRGENIPVVNAVQSFSATTGGTAEARRQVVSVTNCNACHGVVSAHGRNRNGSIETCVVCHNPHATDWQKRQGTTATGEQPIDFKVLIHGVHSADIRHDPMTVYGFNAANAATGGAPGTPNAFPGEIPHGTANCAMCHVSTSYEPALPADAQDTTIDTNGTPLDQSDDTTMPKTIAVCTSCHDQVRFAQETPALPGCSTLSAPNSAPCLHSGGAQTGDASCASCHGRGGLADVTAVHNVH